MNDQATPIKIFISHISEEAPVAALLKNMLEEDFCRKADIFTSSDIGTIRGGAFWLPAVQKAVHEASVFIVLCSKASIQRPWVQFELGLAWSKNVPIVPVCHSTITLKELPIPLNLRQGAEFGTTTGIKLIYKTISDELGMKSIPKMDISHRLNEIKSVENEYLDNPIEQFERYIDVLFTGSVCADEIPSDARVESNQESFRLFGYTSGPRTWKEIERAARKIPDQRWLEQLQKCVAQASRGEDFSTVQAIYHTPRGSFQPQLSKKEVNLKGENRFHIHLVETVVAPLMEVPNEFGLLATLLRFGLRFRFEVIDKHSKLLRRTQGEEALRQMVSQLRAAVEIIKVDALSRGAQNFSPESIVDLFDSDADQMEMQKIQDDWAVAETQLGCMTLTQTEIKAILDKMDNINFRFMRLGTQRFSAMVNEKLSLKSRVQLLDATNV